MNIAARLALVATIMSGTLFADTAGGSDILRPEKTVILVGPPSPEPPDSVGSDGKPLKRPHTNYSEIGARLLQKYLRHACGVKSGFEVVKSDKAVGADGVVIATGAVGMINGDELKDLWIDGYVIRRVGNRVAICGGHRGPAGLSERGTMFGVMRFLDEVANVRVYMNEDLWTSRPSSGTVGLPATLDLRFEPFAKVVSMSGAGGEAITLNGGNTRGGLAGTHQHNIATIFPVPLISEKYPDLLPMVKGVRYQPKDANDRRWNPCFTSPHFVTVAEQAAVRFFQDNPDLLWFSLGLEDNHVSCECDACRGEFTRYRQELRDHLAAGNKAGVTSTYAPLVNVSGDVEGLVDMWARPYALSQMQWRLVNAVAERIEKPFPGRYVEALVYGVTSFVPMFPLRRNVVCYSQIHVSDNVRGHLEPRQDGSLPLDRFLKASEAVGEHEWYRGEGYLAPRIYSGYWDKYLKRAQAANPSLFFCHTEAYPNWGLDGPKLWVLLQQLQDPRRDPKDLWKKHCDDMYGRASPRMVRYFQTLENWYMQQSVEKGPKWGIGVPASVFQRTPEDFALLKEARECLDGASEAAVTTEQRERIAFLSKGLKVTEYLAELGTLDETVTKEKVATVAAYLIDAMNTPALLSVDLGKDLKAQDRSAALVNKAYAIIGGVCGKRPGAAAVLRESRETKRR